MYFTYLCITWKYIYLIPRLCVYVCVYIYKYKHTYIHTYIYTYIHTHASKGSCYECRHRNLLQQNPQKFSETRTMKKKCRKVAKCLEPYYLGQHHQGILPDSGRKTEHKDFDTPIPYHRDDGSRQH
jgi:hypothetical protein